MVENSPGVHNIELPSVVEEDCIPRIKGSAMASFKATELVLEIDAAIH